MTRRCPHFELTTLSPSQLHCTDGPLRARREACRLGVLAHAGAAAHPRGLCAGATVHGADRRDLPAPRAQDREPGADHQGRRRHRGDVPEQPAVHPGLHRRLPAAPPHLFRRARRGPGVVSPPLSRDAGLQAGPHRRRWRAAAVDAPQGTPRAAGRRDRPVGGDHRRRQHHQGDRAQGRPALPLYGRQHGADEAPVRQPLRHGPEHHRGPAGGHQPHGVRQGGDGRRLRLGGQGRGDADARPGRGGDRHRGGRHQGARRADGRASA